MLEHRERLPPGVFAALKAGLVPKDLAPVDPDNYERGHPVEDTTIVPIQVRFYRVDFDQALIHHTYLGLHHKWLFNDYRATHTAHPSCHCLREILRSKVDIASWESIAP